MIRTYRYRIKDANVIARLSAMAGAVNAVWNFCNQTQKFALRWRKQWPGYATLCALTAGSSKALGLHSQTVQAVCEQYVTARQQHGKPSLRWRASRGKRRSLGWIPFKAAGIKTEGAGIYRYWGLTLKCWHSRDLPDGAKIKTGSICEDATGRWYINLTCEVPDQTVFPSKNAIGIDLGLKALATMSNGDQLPQSRFYRDLQPKLGVAQRARKRARVAAIHRKIRNRRRYALHKATTQLVKDNGLIVVGNINASAIAKTKMAKASLDSSWTSFRDMLRYKAMAHGAIVMEVHEAYTTVTCSVCKNRTGPKGLEGLRIREWTCSECGVTHDRDVNAARNILALGHERLAEGIPAL
ncbi:RNA-guided endonuclease TnpB family protein [Sinimarinibacterium sp. NLF-5-8]|uniref:RNA-guided endonuclease InsQ/TnpB family protein n=1 Tax=Sinimarinibacterium sp. NLF-5-8 TaxID=2698684 RepID=UPI00137C2A35|nr:RNA-guided endonuclease TnpB family protein [Sinimarinibacterium sp. NLF-5-8]QHS09100.1 IS200/IS605 family element transposase accessory protein TnpB [Sinimarinibacterium sp. NLF-5-8]